jgi:hypothetical protein
LEKEQEKLLGAKVAVDRMKYINRMREIGVLQSEIPLSLFQKVLSLPLIMASHFDDPFFKILNLNFGRFERRIEVLRAGNLKLA